MLSQRNPPEHLGVLIVPCGRYYIDWSNSCLESVNKCGYHSSVDPQQGLPASTLECGVTQGTHTLIHFHLIHCEELTHLPTQDMGSQCCTQPLHPSATEGSIYLTPSEGIIILHKNLAIKISTKSK